MHRATILPDLAAPGIFKDSTWSISSCLELIHDLERSDDPGPYFVPNWPAPLKNEHLEPIKSDWLA
jgi:hypothetical protein